MADFSKLLQDIDAAIADFNKKIPAIQQRMFEKLQIELRKLDLKGDNIKISTANIKTIATLKNKLLDVILTPQYEAAVKNFLQIFNQVTTAQNQYFKSVDDSFSPLQIVEEIKKQAIKSVIDDLTERGLHVNLVDPVQDLLMKNTTSGASYFEMQKSLENFMLNNDTGEGKLMQYAKQITTDAVNQYSAQQTFIISNDFGYEWYVYQGTNIETSRPFCLACTDKKYIHISEFPALLAGDFPEFDKYDGTMYKGLPSGMIKGTTVSNFPIYRGGYNCGHQLRPVPESMVPENIKAAVYATAAYQAWKR